MAESSGDDRGFCWRRSQHSLAQLYETLFLLETGDDHEEDLVLFQRSSTLGLLGLVQVLLNDSRVLQGGKTEDAISGFLSAPEVGYFAVCVHGVGRLRPWKWPSKLPVGPRLYCV